MAKSGGEICSENYSSDGSNASDNDLIVEAFQVSNKLSTETEDLPSDDSDAPVGLSWKDSKAVFEQDKRDRNNAINYARSVDKARRRKKNEIFVAQKEAKWKLTKLPDDIIEAVANKPKQIELDKIEEEREKLKRKKAIKHSNTKRNKKKLAREENCHVVILEDEVIKSKKVQETAAEFLRNHFYGDRLVRTSGPRQLTMESKSSGVVKPAVKFNNK
ncbi:bud site selection protein 21-like [Dendronephthya gigantea]|uniref:bud site selection protein 21-like n=1 Tax=Dendronephthya gigantea TaxID=151771 RepID=UPI00106BDE9E|nr:bud site selection protein 21-like [Dendronephthya gigantea]